MSRHPWIVAAAIAIVLLSVLVATRRAPPAVVDLIAQFPSAVTRPAAGGPNAPRVADRRIGRETKRAIVVGVPSRIIWHVTVPGGAWLRTWIGVDEHSLVRQDDGVQFRISVLDGNSYEELFARHLDPLRSNADRGWLEVNVSLAKHGDHAVDIIFNTDMSPDSEDADRRELACWGAPAITLKR
jgi:hypothetical protein